MQHDHGEDALTHLILTVDSMHLSHGHRCCPCSSSCWYDRPIAPSQAVKNSIIDRVRDTPLGEAACAVSDTFHSIQDLHYIPFNNIPPVLLERMQQRLEPPEEPLESDEDRETRGPIPEPLINYYSLAHYNESLRGLLLSPRGHAYSSRTFDSPCQ